MTLIFNRVLEVVKAHERTKVHQAECSGLEVILHAEKKNFKENNTSVATAQTVIMVRKRQFWVQQLCAVTLTLTQIISIHPADWLQVAHVTNKPANHGLHR